MAEPLPSLPPANAASLGQQTDLAGDVSSGALDLLRKVRKHWAIVVATFVVVFLAGTFSTLGQKKIYQSQGTMLFDPNPPRPLGRGVEMVVEGNGGNFWYMKEAVETQLKMIKSMRVALAVVRDMGLDHDGAFIENQPRGARVVTQQVSQDAAARLLQKRTEVELTKNTFLVTVRYEDADPERAQRITNAIVDTFIQLNMEDMQSSTGSAVEWLNSQLDKLKVGLETSELALHEYKRDKNILSVDIDAQSNMLREEIRQISAALTSARIKREELGARRDELMKVKTDDPSNLPSSELMQNGLLSELRKAYIDSSREREGLIKNGKGLNHPEVLAASSKVELTRTALLSEVRNVQGAVARDYAVVAKQEGGLSSLYERAKKQALDLNLLEIEYKRLWRSKENNEKLYGLVLERAKETDLTRMLRVNNIRVIDRPLLNGSPIKPNIKMSLLISGLTGLLLGLVGAVLRDLLDRSIKTAADIEGIVGLPVLGVLPLVNESARKASYYGRKRKAAAADQEDSPAEFLVHNLPKSGAAEAARAIRTNLQFMAPDRPIKSLLVTSAGPGEGKTTVACTIAIALAQAGHRVVIVDCDLRRPRIGRLFDLPSDVGVSSALAGDASVESLPVASHIERLDVLASGPIPPNPSELLQCDRFHRLLQHLVERYDRVVIDSPPILPITDAAVLATQVDGLVLVTRAFKTTKEHGKQARRTIETVGGRIFGCVLNAIDLSRVEYKHYYYHYYKKDTYGYGYKAPENQSAS